MLPPYYTCRARRSRPVHQHRSPRRPSQFHDRTPPSSANPFQYYPILSNNPVRHWPPPCISTTRHFIRSRPRPRPRHQPAARTIHREIPKCVRLRLHFCHPRAPEPPFVSLVPRALAPARPILPRRPGLSRSSPSSPLQFSIVTICTQSSTPSS